MSKNSKSPFGVEIARLIELMAKVQGLGPKSARRAVLALLKRRENLMLPLAQALNEAAIKISNCDECGNLDTYNPCSICTGENRDDKLICVVAEVSDLWAIERAGGFCGKYHVLGGLLSALDGIGPNDLKIPELVNRIAKSGASEVILALSATIDGQSTAHYIAQVLDGKAHKISRLSHGLPIGGELDHIDDSTLMTALNSRLLI